MFDFQDDEASEVPASDELIIVDETATPEEASDPVPDADKPEQSDDVVDQELAESG